MSEKDEWQFEAGEVAREENSKNGAMGEPLPKNEYKIKRRLIDSDTGEQFYKVEKEEGGTHLYSEDVLNIRFEPINIEESRIWPKEEGGLFD